MFVLKTQPIFFSPLYIYLEVFEKQFFRKLWFYYFFNIEIRVNFLYRLKAKNYFLYFFKENIIASVSRTFKIKKERLTLIRAPFVFKKSKEQFERRIYKWQIQTYFLDFFIFHQLLQMKALSKFDLRYKVKVKEYGTLVF